MKRQTSTVTLLPFGPHQHQPQHSLAWSSQRSTTRSRLPSVLGVSVPCIMSAPAPSQLFEVSRRPNQLRIRPSIISEASSCDTSSSSSSSSSSSFPSTSPTSCSNSSPSLPPSPPPYVHFLLNPFGKSRHTDRRRCHVGAMPESTFHHDRIPCHFLISPSNRSLGKSRPLPQPPAPAPTERLPFSNNAADPGQFRPRTPPPAWSPPETETSFIPAGIVARPTRPRVMLPSLPQERLASESPRTQFPPSSPFTRKEGTISSPVQPRVRPLPTRPVPPGPPSEDNTPVAPFGLPRWQADTLTTPQDNTSLSPYDDRRAIDWDLIDEVMEHAG